MEMHRTHHHLAHHREIQYPSARIPWNLEIVEKWEGRETKAQEKEKLIEVMYSVCVGVWANDGSSTKVDFGSRKACVMSFS